MITPTGGTRDIPGNDYYSLDNGTSWIPFPNNASYTITGLNLGTYRIKVKDMNGCIARIQTLVDGKIELGEEKVLEETITEPISALSVDYTFKQDPTFNGAYFGLLYNNTQSEENSSSVFGIKLNNSYTVLQKHNFSLGMISMFRSSTNKSSNNDIMMNFNYGYNF